MPSGANHLSSHRDRTEIRTLAFRTLQNLPAAQHFRLCFVFRFDASSTNSATNFFGFSTLRNAPLANSLTRETVVGCLAVGAAAS